MYKPNLSTILVLAALLCGCLPALAQTGSTGKPTSGSDRLFLAFIEDATLVDGQWWEVQVETADFDAFDANVIRGVAAFQPWIDFEETVFREQDGQKWSRLTGRKR